MNSLNKIKGLIDNKINYPFDKYYTAIIGTKPSEGARSPILWNKAFEKNLIDINMLPFDVKEKNIKKLLSILINDKYFLGGAVTNPYKEKIFSFLNPNVLKEAKLIGAINCLFRKNNQLYCTNTDGEASLKVFKKNFGHINNKTILILGLGGAGKAVASFFSKENNTNVFICTTNLKNITFINKIDAKFVEWPNIDLYLSKVDIIVNCTDLGSIEKIEKTPITNEQFKKVKLDSIVYDIIYNPRLSNLLKIAKRNNIKIMNGLEMNLEQAVIAFNYCVDEKLIRFDTAHAMKER